MVVWNCLLFEYLKRITFQYNLLDFPNPLFPYDAREITKILYLRHSSANLTYTRKTFMQNTLIILWHF